MPRVRLSSHRLIACNDLNNPQPPLLRLVDSGEMDWLPVAGTLLGTMIGSAGTIAAQHVTSRTLERTARLALTEQIRVERRAVIEEFNQVYQEIEQLLSDRHGERPTEVIHHMWTLRNKLALVASDELHQAVDELANALGSTWFHGTPDGVPVYEHLGAARRRFHAVSRAEVRPDAQPV